MSVRTTRSEKLDLRLTPAAKQILQAAASVSRRTVSDFVLESALTRADEALRIVVTLFSMQINGGVCRCFNVPHARYHVCSGLLTESGFFDAPTER